LSLGFAHSLLGAVACLRTTTWRRQTAISNANAADLQAVRAAVLLAQIYFYILLAGEP
jgi:hypothetical protein